MTVDVEGAWQRLQRQLDVARGFWLGFVFASSAHARDLLARRTAGVLRDHERPMRVLRFDEPESLRESPGTLLETIDARGWHEAGCIWLEAAELEPLGSSASPWRDAWIDVLFGLNQLRDPLRARLNGGLIIAGPVALRRLVTEVAPDLWAVRGMVLDVHASDPGSAPLLTLLSEVPPARWSGRSLAAVGASDTGELAQLARLLRRVEQLRETGDPRSAVPVAAQAVSLGRQVGAQEAEAIALAVQADAQEAAGDVPGALQSDKEAAALIRDVDGGLALELLARLSDRATRSRDVQTALTAIRDGVALAERLTGDLDPSGPGSLPWWLERLGAAQHEVGDFDAAAEAYAAALDRALEAGAATPESSEAQRTVARLFVRLGDLALARGNMTEALSLYERARGALHPDPEKAIAGDAVVDAASVHERLGMARERMGDPAGGLEAYDQAVELGRRVVDRYPSSKEAAWLLARLVRSKGDALRALGDAALAADAYREAAADMERVLAEDATPDGLSSLSRVLDRLGEAELANGNLAAARAAFERALEIDRIILAADERSSSALALGFALQRLGRLAIEEGRLADAAEHFREALQTSRDLGEVAGDSAAALQVQAEALIGLGDVSREHGERASMLAAYHEALPILERLAYRVREQPHTLEALALLLGRIGAARMAEDDTDAARIAFERAVDADQRLLARSGDRLETLARLRSSLEALVSLYRRQGDESAARSLQREAERIGHAMQDAVAGQGEGGLIRR